jgi:hypothetical protein
LHFGILTNGTEYNGSISSWWKCQKVATTTAAKKVEASNDRSLTSDDPEIQAFYNQLTDKERIAHSIAVDKLGTSYDVSRTHGFLKWKKSVGTK